MLYLEDYADAQKFHNDLVRCWLLIKIQGKEGPTYRSGHNCKKVSCQICSIDSKISNKIPQNLKDFLLKKNNLETLINGKPNDLRMLHNRFSKLVFTVGEKQKIKEFFEDTAYKNWFQKMYGFHFLRKLNSYTCVYCNRGLTRAIGDVNGNKVMIADIDHWFPKDKYPILTISFYNLIPSCLSCNRSIKNNAPKIIWDRALRNYIHPYLKDDKDFFKFSYINKSQTDFNVKIDVSPNSKTDKTLKFFKVQEVYNSHSDLELKDLIDLKHKYSENYIDMLVNRTFKGILKPNEIYRLIFGIEVEEKLYHKRPLSKFKHDIIEELFRRND